MTAVSGPPRRVGRPGQPGRPRRSGRSGTAGPDRLARWTTRVCWRWCRVYTAVTPAGARERRRLEIYSHLWESEGAALPGGAVLLASVRGSAADIGWVIACGLPVAGRAFRTPTPYVVLAAVCPLQAWALSALAPSSVAGPSEVAGSAGGAALLLVALVAWLTGRRRQR